jgi:hypothetical protein
MSSARTYITSHGQSTFYALGFLVRTRRTRERGGKFHLLLKREPLFHRQAVRLCNDRHYVHYLAQLLQHDDVDRAQRMAGGINEEQRAVDPGILNVTVSHCRQLFSEVRAVLVFDVFDDRVPAERGNA